MRRAVFAHAHISKKKKNHSFMLQKLYIRSRKKIPLNLWDFEWRECRHEEDRLKARRWHPNWPSGTVEVSAARESEIHARAEVPRLHTLMSLSSEREARRRCCVQTTLEPLVPLAAWHKRVRPIRCCIFIGIYSSENGKIRDSWRFWQNPRPSSA